MALKLMYITNRPDVAQIAESAGVDRIFVDMEYIGKNERQGGMDTVQSHHTVDDIANIRASIETADLLVRVNPIHGNTEKYSSSAVEIDAVVRAGADIVMLPYFKTVEEVQEFVRLVDGRAKTMLLVETPEAVEIIDDILKVKGVDEVFIGLNDLSLGYGMKFMFELLANGTVERLCLKFKQAGIPYGFGGIASLGKGKLPSEYVIKEHYKFGSTCAILSRSFCNVNKINHIGKISATFVNGVKELRTFEAECQKYADFFNQDEAVMVQKVQKIIESLEMGGTTR
ncbi:MAG: HpcH/HpaI aldolase/citrate lyase family protein [Eubacterium sp.]|nr:HpcH/HpaI aldolase/citrate lyase family protein [Eubacterium sp.]